jgi:hypothetical protein
MPDIELLPWHVGGGNLAGQETGRQHLSHTALSAFLSCPQKYEYSYERRLTPVATAEPLTLGKAYQLAIEHNDPALGARSLREGTIVKSQAHEDKLRVYETIVTSASTLYLETFKPRNQSPGPSIGDGGMLPLPSRYWTPPRGVKEFEYKVRLRNPRTGYVSRTHDLLGYADEWIDMGGYAGLVENKLVGQISELSVRRLPLDRQIALACYGTWRATGLEVREVFYRFVRKPSIKQRQNETVDEYCERLSADYAARPEFYCHEEHFLRSSEDLLRVEQELWEWSAQIRRQRAGNTTCRNTSHCTDYGGCAFIPLCLGEDGADGLYEVRPHRTSVQSGVAPVSASS